MRLSFLFASGVLAASVALAGCSTSGGSSQAIPGGGSQTSMSRHGGPQLMAVGVKAHKGSGSCPSSFYECVEISAKSPATQQWCIVYSGTSDCSDLYPGTWTWTAESLTVKKDKPTKKIDGSFSPNPGNPTTLTISAGKKTKPTKGKVKYAVEFETCNSVGSCLGPIVIGVSVEGKKK